MFEAILRVAVMSGIIFLIAQYMPGIRLKNYQTALVVAIVYSIINFLLVKVLVFLSLPAIILTFGLFIFIINAALLWLTDKLIDDFHIDGFGRTVIAAALITIGMKLVEWLLF